ncbi:hypothetical protein [Paracoccus albicereus]|uniref:hypothetical protein n=1 Tax=Paracoccus albicereus TaxID=2922394 RepID=UPI00210099FC|nr:hypothetical protein [Paracoccus albicereus]
MQMLPLEDTAWAPLPGENAESRISVGPYHATVPGLALRKAFQLEARDPISGYLFFTDDDCPFEERLSITLTDQTLTILDRVSFGAPYRSANLQDSVVAGPGAVDVTIHPNERWRLTVLPRAEWRLPIPSHDGWRWRGFSARRHLRLDRLTPAN